MTISRLDLGVMTVRIPQALQQRSTKGDYIVVISYEGKDRRTVNYRRAIYFDYPEWTPCRVGLMPATWIKYRKSLEEIVLAHPALFPDYRRGNVNFDFPSFPNPLYELGRHVDCWGTVWENRERGLDSYPVAYPLDDWAKLAAYTPPDPMREAAFGPRDWESEAARLREAKAAGKLAVGGGLMHGFMYMRLYYLRGFENLMMDIALDHPRLPELIEMVTDYNAAVIRKYVELGAEMISVGDDLGLQNALPMSPRKWRQYLKPAYMRIFEPCREADIPVYFHTDGHILEIIPDLIEVGVRVLNPQFRANGLEGLQAVARGRVALDQDLDRQLFPFATSDEIAVHIATVHATLGLPEGGLMLYAECEPDVPLENIEAICTALEQVCGLPPGL